MNQQEQERISALTVQVHWLSTVLMGLAVTGGVIALLPKVIGVIKKEK